VASTPLFLVSADCKGFAGGRLVSAESARLKVAEFSVIWEWLVRVDSKEVTGAICLQESNWAGPLGVARGKRADSKGVRRTAGPIEAPFTFARGKLGKPIEALGKQEGIGGTGHRRIVPTDEGIITY
jgi:hypothetical protein